MDYDYGSSDEYQSNGENEFYVKKTRENPLAGSKSQQVNTFA